jgi:hypothetical protein
VQTQAATLRYGMEELVSVGAPSSWLAPSGADLQHSGRAAVAQDRYQGCFSHQSMPHHPRRRSAHGAPRGGKPDWRSYKPAVIASRARPKQDGKLHLELRRNPGKENAYRPFGSSGRGPRRLPDCQDLTSLRISSAEHIIPSRRCSLRLPESEGGNCYKARSGPPLPI